MIDLRAEYVRLKELHGQMEAEQRSVATRARRLEDELQLVQGQIDALQKMLAWQSPSLKRT